MTTLQQIAQLCQPYVDGKVIFDEPLKVKATPHQHIFTVFGVWSGPEGVYVLDGAGEWHGPLLESQVYGNLMISSIYQRLKALPAPVSVVIAEYDANINATIFE